MGVNNNISEIHVGFKLAMLLKEKGAELDTIYCRRSQSGLYYYIQDSIEDKKHELYTYNWFNNFSNMLSAPTLHLAQEWVRHNYGYTISIKKFHRRFKANIEYPYLIQEKNKAYFKSCTIPDFVNRNPNNAIEEALLYCLENLNIII